MIEETVLAVNGTRIATETGGKIPIGNREYQIGESVWTDGPFAFGTERFSGMVMPIMGEPTEITGRFIVEYIGSGSDWLFRVRDSTDLEQKVDVTTNQFAAFTYNTKATKFAAFTIDGNDVIIRESTEAGVTETTVTLENGPASNIYCYYDSSDVLHWIAFVNSFVYDHHFDVTYDSKGWADTYTEIYSHDGYVIFYEYTYDTLIGSTDITSKVQGYYDDCWNKINSIAGQGTNVQIGFQIISETTVAGHQAFEDSYWGAGKVVVSLIERLWDDTTNILKPENYIQDQRASLFNISNRPSIVGAKATLNDYRNSFVEINTNASADILSVGNDSNAYSMSKPWVSEVWPRIVGHADVNYISKINDTIDDIYTKYEHVTEDEYVAEKGNLDIYPRQDKYLYDSIDNVWPPRDETVMDWSRGRTWLTYTGEQVDVCNDHIDTFSAGCGYDIVYTKETDGTILIQLKYGETWDMDITEICNSSINHEIPPMVIILDADNILFYETAQNNMYKITLSTKQYSVIHSDHIHNNQILKTDECIKNNILGMLSMFKK